MATPETRAEEAGGPHPPQLLREVMLLELVARRNVASQLSGSYRTAIRGQGMEFHEARRYVQGEPIRRIDWRMTARMREPYVRTFLEERQREVVLAVDVSPSMRVGWGLRTKLETAVELAATLAVSAIDAGDRVGLLLFSDELELRLPPAQGRRALYRVLRALLDWLPDPAAGRRSDVRAAIHGLQSWRGRRFVVFLLSDFLDPDLPEDFRFVQRRHDVTLVHLYDPFEYVQEGEARAWARDAENQAERGLWRPGLLPLLEERQRELRTMSMPRGLSFLSVSTGDELGGRLLRYFSHRRH